MADIPPSSATSPRASADFVHAGYSAYAARGEQASTSTRLDEDVKLWRSLKVEDKKNLRAPIWFSEKDVPVNASKIRCANNGHTIKVVIGNDKSTSAIHAHSVTELLTPEPSCNRANLTYAAGQSPTQENYKNMLIQGIESGLGTFQLVSTTAHRHGCDSRETPLIKLLEAALDNPSKTLNLSDRYEVTKLEKIAGDFGKSNDHVQFAMTVRDKQNPGRLITVPLTQAALPFTNKVLQPEKIVRADELMQAHCDLCEQQAENNKRDINWQNLMVLSHAGYGRNATVITYCTIAARARHDTDSVNQNNICEKMKEVITIGMTSRDPNFVHSQPQMSALRMALENCVSGKKITAPHLSRPDIEHRLRSCITSSADDLAPTSKTPQVEKTPQAVPILQAETTTRAEMSMQAETTAQAETTPQVVTALQSEMTAIPTIPVESISATPSAENSEPPVTPVLGPQQSIVNFFDRSIPATLRGSSQPNINAVLAYGDDDLENVHNFIQHLFPIDTESKHYRHAPVLNGADFLVLRNNVSVLKGLDDGFKLMLKFYGLKWDKNKVEADSAKRMLQDLPVHSHHYLRLTRMIRSLSLFGKHVEAKALYDYLMSADAIPKPPATVEFWKKALNHPIKIPYANPQPGYETYLFPNKILSEELRTSHRDASPGLFTSSFEPERAEVLKKQAATYEAARPISRPDLPLKASFASEATVNAYRNKDFLTRPLGGITSCKIETTDRRYFPNIESNSDPQSDRADQYDMHVDFANAAFGGGWRRDRCKAQEEMAFIENVGLGRVAHQPWLDTNTPEHALRKESQLFGPAYSTRKEDGTPSPIVVENCELLDEMRDAEASKDGQSRNANQPTMTNWLAIAAEDYRKKIITGNRLHPAEVKQKWQSASAADRKAAFTDLFITAHAGFAMAKEIAGQKPLRIHSGRLGCGVFRNSWPISAAAQLLAARVVGVQSIKLYDVKDNAEIEKIEKIIADCLEKSESNKAIRSVFEEVANTIAGDPELS